VKEGGLLAGESWKRRGIAKLVVSCREERNVIKKRRNGLLAERLEKQGGWVGELLQGGRTDKDPLWLN